MKKLLFLILMFLSSFVFAEEVVQTPYERCSPNDFYIAPWGFNVSEGDLVDYDKIYDDMYQAGFNCSSFVRVINYKKAFAHNLSPIIFDPVLIDENIKDYNERYTKWANLIKDQMGDDLKKTAMVFITDEPQDERLEWMKAQCTAVRNILGCTPYVNFLPSHSINTYLKSSYEDYYGKYIDACGLSVLSYDSYCYFVDYGFDEDQFYSDIQDMQNMAKKHNVKFVNTILSNAHFNYAPPDDFSINIQGWSTLAYGGNGIFYWTFTNVHRGNYRDAAYYHNGSRTPLWYVIRDMNYSIHNIMPYYKNLKNVNVFHVGNIPKGAKGIESAKIIKKCKITRDEWEDDPRVVFTPNYLVGEFVGSDGNEYAIIVNKDPKHSIYVKDFEFKRGKTLCRIADRRYKKKEVEFTGEDRWIAPGHGILLKGEVPENMYFETLDDWKFIKDPKNQGDKKGYAKPDFNFKNWKNINVNTNWEETIGDYDGYGWYKTNTEIENKKSVYLYFGAVDEEASIYVNGKLAFEHTVAKTGLTPVQLWNKPFAVNIKPFIKDGKNDITVKVHDDKQAGGIYKGVSLVYSEKDITAEEILKTIK